MVDINPVAFSLGTFDVRWYGAMYFFGIFLGWLYMRSIRKDFPGLMRSDVDDLIPWIVCGIVLGGRLGYVFFYHPAMLWQDPLAILNTRQGGMAFHGGVLGVLSAMFLYARRRGIVLGRLCDLLAAATPIGIFFGRIGNFINQEAYGRITDVSWAVTFARVDGLARHPSQLYEAGLEGVFLFVMLFFVRRACAAFPWMLTSLFLLAYGCLRCFAELYRVPDGLWFVTETLVITHGQLLSLPMILIGGGRLWWQLRNMR